MTPEQIAEMKAVAEKATSNEAWSVGESADGKVAIIAGICQIIAVKRSSAPPLERRND